MGITNRHYGPDQIVLREASPTMEHIRNLIQEKESFLVQAGQELLEKKQILCASEATKSLDPGDRGAAVRSGLARSKIAELEVEVVEAKRLVEGLNMKFTEAEAAEKARLYGELSDTVSREGARLLSLISEFDLGIEKHNAIVEEITAVMKSTLWRGDTEKILGVGGCQLPLYTTKKIMLDQAGNYFLDHVRQFCSESEEEKSLLPAEPAQA